MKKVKQIIFHPLFSGSAIMMVGFNFANFLAYLFHLIIGRKLGPSLYGDLASVISLVNLTTAPFTFLGLVITKFISAGKSKREIESIFSWFVKKILIIGFLVSIVNLPFVPVVSGFLHVNKDVIFLMPLILFFSILSFAYKAFLQGLLRFTKLVIASNVEYVFRLLLAVVFVYLGMEVFGAILGILVSTVIGVLLILYYLRDFRIDFKKDHFKGGGEVISFSVAFFVLAITSTSFLTVDVILAKHFLDSHSAGIYASLSTLGKIILYGAAPIGSVMFPLVSQRHARGEKFLKIFYMSLIGTSAIVLTLLFFYNLFPELAINLLYGKKFLDGAGYLIWFGLYSGFFSLSSLVVSFFMSVGRKWIVALTVIFSLFQVAGIYIYGRSILSIIGISLTSSLLLFLSLVIYFIYYAYLSQK